MTRVTKRSLRTVAAAALQPRHYRAALNILRVCHQPALVLYRYLTGVGTYPWDVTLRTPIGPVTTTLYSHHDLLTVNEVFCRLDYFVDERPRVIVDIGSNIGLSALYFLTRSRETRCYLYEPVPDNLRRLERTLAAYRDRYAVEGSAVADIEGMVEFGTEPTGRYGGIGVEAATSITVRCRAINAVVEEVLRREGRIDLIKLDTEGAEERTVLAIDPRHHDRIGALYLEARPGLPLLPGRFAQEQYGEVVRLYNLGGVARRAGARSSPS